MERRVTSRRLTAAFLMLSLALSLLVLARRNLYDDEVMSLELIGQPVRTILAIAAEGDVHPPGMYLLGHFAHKVIPSYRWMNLAPIAALYVGLGFFLTAVVPLFRRRRTQVCVLLVGTLHPQLLMWGGSFRWYSWWTGLALLALTATLQPHAQRPILSARRAIALGLLLAGLFYLNYITFFFAAALIPAAVWRYRHESRLRMLGRFALTGAVWLGLMAPQLHTMVAVHIPAGRAQRSGIGVSFARLLESLVASEAFLPWHPLAIAAGLVFLGLAIWWSWIWIRRGMQRPTGSLENTAEEPLIALVIFALVFFLMVAGSGLGGKARNGLLLVPLTAVVLGLVTDGLRARWQYGVIGFFAVWSAAGIGHLAGRYGMAKSEMNERPEQVVALVRNQGEQSQCSVVVTYDSVLAFELAQARLPQTLVVSPFRGDVFGGNRGLNPETCTALRLYTVQSYLGASERGASTYNSEMDAAMQSIEGPRAVARFSFDPDASRKRRLRWMAGAQRLPDFRYVVTSGAVAPASLTAILSTLRHFYSTGMQQAGS